VREPSKPFTIAPTTPPNGTAGRTNSVLEWLGWTALDFVLAAGILYLIDESPLGSTTWFLIPVFLLWTVLSFTIGRAYGRMAWGFGPIAAVLAASLPWLFMGGYVVLFGMMLLFALGPPSIVIGFIGCLGAGLSPRRRCERSGEASQPASPPLRAASFPGTVSGAGLAAATGSIPAGSPEPAWIAESLGETLRQTGFAAKASTASEPRVRAEPWRNPRPGATRSRPVNGPVSDGDSRAYLEDLLATPYPRTMSSPTDG
jgi:hypothetical protein